MQLETPNFIHPIQITQLDNLCRHPTVPRVMHSANFMKSQLPARLENHIARLKVSSVQQLHHMQVWISAG